MSGIFWFPLPKPYPLQAFNVSAQPYLLPFKPSRAEHGCRSTPHTKLPSELTSTSPNPPGALTTYHGTSLSCQTTTPAINSPEQIPPSPPRPPSRRSPFPVLLRSNRPSEWVALDLMVLTGLPTAALPRRSAASRRAERRRSLLSPLAPLGHHRPRPSTPPGSPRLPHTPPLLPRCR